MRLEIPVPETEPFITRIPVRIGDMNYGGHLGNDRYLSVIHEARVQWLNHFGYTELDIEGVGLVMNEAALQYKAEVFYPDTLICHIYCDEIGRAGFRLAYTLISEASGTIAVLAQTGQVFYDYKNKKIARTPALFRRRVAP